jgi:hypothetical protein
MGILRVSMLLILISAGVLLFVEFIKPNRVSMGALAGVWPGFAVGFSRLSLSLLSYFIKLSIMMSIIAGLGGSLLKQLAPAAINWGMKKLTTSNLGKRYVPAQLVTGLG